VRQVRNIGLTARVTEAPDEIPFRMPRRHLVGVYVILSAVFLLLQQYMAVSSLVKFGGIVTNVL
jgi:hypothetical protein